MIEIGPDKPALRRRLKALRKAHEAVGARLVIDTGQGAAEMVVDTEGDDLSKLTALFVRVQAGLQQPPLKFKGGGRFYSLTVIQLTAVAEAAAGHVNRGYAAEAVVSAVIDSGSCRTLTEVETAFAAALAQGA